MPDPINLTGDIALAIDGAALRGSTVVVGYVDDDGFASLSFRGSVVVHGPQQLAFWSRSTSGGLIDVIGRRPGVSLLYYGGADGPGARYLSIRGRARVAPDANDAVYAAMIEGERGQDPEQNGVAVIIDVDSVQGFGADGAFAQARED